MINALEVINVNDTKYFNHNNNELFNLKNINKINIFVGENNSGKSRMLRAFVKNSSIKILSDEFMNSQKIYEFKQYKNNLLRRISYFNSVSDFKIEIDEKVIKKNYTDFYCEISEIIEPLKPLESNFKGDELSYFNAMKNDLNCIYQLISRPQNSNRESIIKENDITYIPILRGIENYNQYYDLKKSSELDSISLNAVQREALDEYKDNSKHIYLNKISSAYDINKRYIFTAEDLFDEIKSKLLGIEEERIAIKNFEEFISREFFDEEGFTIIPQIKKGYLNVKIGNGEERPLHDLGDGIKQLITIFYKIYEKKDIKAIFLIEEPELNLHPGYQRKLIRLLENNDLFKNHQYFITTHSNHLIDSCLCYDNISIYKFININKRNNSFKIVNTSKNDIDVLNLLGVNNSSVFMSNCTIWVEGISDKILISKYLSIYLKYNNVNEYKEDINYSFVEYGGNNIVHWSFISDEDIKTINASGITNRSFIICDNDNEKKKKRKENLKNIFGDERFYELTVREIENTINRKILEKTLFNNNEIKYKIPFKNNAYANKSTYMGRFIDEHYDLRKKYGNNSTGTITNKLEFALKIAQNINDISDLSTQAKKLCEKIYNFIKSSNN